MRSALRQTPRAPSLCLQCTIRLIYGTAGSLRAPGPASRSLSTSGASAQSAAAAAAAADDAEPRVEAGQRPANPFSSSSGRIQWGMGRTSRTGLAASEQQERERLLQRERPPSRPERPQAPRRERPAEGSSVQRRPLIRYSAAHGENDRKVPQRWDAGASGHRPMRQNTIDQGKREDGSRPLGRQPDRPREPRTREWQHVRRDAEHYQPQEPRRDRVPPEPRRDRAPPAERQAAQASQPRPEPQAWSGRGERYEKDQTQDRQRVGKGAEKGRQEAGSRRRDQDANSATLERRAVRRRRDSDSYEDNLSEEAVERMERHQQRKKEKELQAQAKAKTLVPIVLPEFISVGTLAGALKLRVEDFVSKLNKLGFEDVANDHVVDAETAGLVASEFGFEPILPRKESGQDLVAQPVPDDTSFLLNRPPVVTIMGHVDHGKTTLLDWLRNSSVAASEHGGITQHIGAFTVPMPSGRVLTFLDTPGHAAFLAMRARGANVTDIVILVVAADDSVKPQTIEAIKHAKDAKSPIIVAISKADKPEADPQRVKQDLARYGVEVEDFGGDVQTVEVSGKTGQGMENLEEAVLALADMLDARAPTDGPVEGWVLESSAGRAGKTATVLVRRGTLTPGTMLVAGTTWTRVRSLRDEHGNELDSAGPGTPVLVDGWRDQPGAGDEALQASSEQRAKEAIEVRVTRAQTAKMAQDVTTANQARAASAAAEAAELAAAAEGQGEEAEAAQQAAAQLVAAHKAREASGGVPELPLVLRGDVSGSVDALEAYVQSLGGPLIRPHVLRAQVGQVTASDIALAQATGGTVVAFSIDVPSATAQAAERAGVPVVAGNVIYRVIDEVKAAMEARLPDEVTRRVLGEAAVLEVFEIGVGGKRKLKVAGVRVGNGLLKAGGRVRVVRGGKVDDGLTSDLGAGRKGARRTAEPKDGGGDGDGGEQVVYDGSVASLRNHKKEVAEMRKGSECGMSFGDGFAEFEPGDRVQCYEEIRERRKL